MLEGKKCEVADFYDQRVAIEVIQAARAAYDRRKQG